VQWNCSGWRDRTVKSTKSFEEFVKQNIVKKQSSDKSRAEFLIKESEKSLSGLNKRVNVMGIDEDNTNSIIKDCYDILMGIIRAKMLLKGYNASGLGAHEAEVSYLKVLEFNENDIQFADKLRYFRNGMLYYGTILDEEYAKKVFEFTKKIYSKLKNVK